MKTWNIRSGFEEYPAQYLPEGWTWREYDDGSGGLDSPQGEKYYSFDQATEEGKFSFGKNADRWGSYRGSSFFYAQLEAEALVAIEVGMPEIAEQIKEDKYGQEKDEELEL